MQYVIRQGLATALAAALAVVTNVATDRPADSMWWGLFAALVLASVAVAVRVPEQAGTGRRLRWDWLLLLPALYVTAGVFLLRTTLLGTEYVDEDPALLALVAAALAVLTVALAATTGLAMAIPFTRRTAASRPGASLLATSRSPVAVTFMASAALLAGALWMHVGLFDASGQTRTAPDRQAAENADAAAARYTDCQEQQAQAEERLDLLRVELEREVQGAGGSGRPGVGPLAGLRRREVDAQTAVVARLATDCEDLQREAVETAGAQRRAAQEVAALAPTRLPVRATVLVLSGSVVLFTFLALLARPGAPVHAPGTATETDPGSDRRSPGSAP